MSNYVQKVLDDVKAKNANEPEFVQAVTEVLLSLAPAIEKNENLYRKYSILERMVEPDRAISFRVVWEYKDGNYQVTLQRVAE